jgi:hypothetical protein
MSAAGPPAQAAGADVARAARQVFQDQRFWWKRVTAGQVRTSVFDSILAAVRDFFARILEEIVDLLARILRGLLGGFHGASSGGAVAVWLVITALLAWSIWKLGPALLRWLRATVPGPDLQEGATPQALAEASKLFEQAGQALREGMHAEAIRLALLALIARLEKQGLLRYDTTRTNREYQVELRQTTDLAGRFGQLARIYERVWYGRLPASRSDAEEAINLCGSILSREVSTAG